MSDELARRHRQVQLVVALIYLGIPLVLLAVAVVDGRALVVPVVLLVLGWYLRSKQRYQPRWWGVVGVWFGAVAGVTATVAPLLRGAVWPVFLVLPAMVAGMIVGAALARYAVRVLLVPIDVELADTRYELVFPLRGVRLTTVVLGTRDVSVRAPRAVRHGGAEPAKTYALTAVTGVHDASLTGAERLRFPIPLPFPPVGTAGPAVILQVAGDDWVLPTDYGPALAQLLNRRVETARELGG